MDEAIRVETILEAQGREIATTVFAGAVSIVVGSRM